MECFGIPLHGWICENIRKIGEQLGNGICFDEKIEYAESFGSAHIFIETCYFQPVQEWGYRSIEGRVYDIFVKEIRGEL